MYLTLYLISDQTTGNESSDPFPYVCSPLVNHCTKYGTRYGTRYSTVPYRYVLVYIRPDFLSSLPYYCTTYSMVPVLVRSTIGRHTEVYQVPTVPLQHFLTGREQISYNLCSLVLHSEKCKCKPGVEINQTKGTNHLICYQREGISAVLFSCPTWYM